MPKENDIGKNSYLIARQIFIRLLGVIYLIAFSSLWVQIIGLLGENGILPIKLFLAHAEEVLGSKSFLKLPTVFWLNSSDQALHAICGLGVFFSLLIIFNILPAVSLLILWFLYLSIVNVGQDFLSFQWDILLLEIGFLSIFLAPWKRSLRPSRWLIFLFHLLLFKLMVQSGAVKLLSKDSTWSNLTALTYHYWTQPIPNPLSWSMHHLPLWVHKMSCFFMFVIELVMPFGIFLIRPARLASFWSLVTLQVLILLTGNYCFFNLCAVLLCLLLLDDRYLEKCTEVPVLRHLIRTHETTKGPPWAVWIKRGLTGIVFCMMIGLSVFQFYRMLAKPTAFPEPLLKIVAAMNAFEINNSYGLFAVMTKDRPEIIIEGSMDEITWKAYEFPYKPGDLKRRPPQVAPHQPRLDWQMWFAALQPDIRYAPWVVAFMRKLLEGSRDVQGLLAYDPFDGTPPRYIRAKVYDYHFTSPQERRETRQWWSRTLRGYYSPELTLP